MLSITESTSAFFSESGLSPGIEVSASYPLDYNKDAFTGFLNALMRGENDEFRFRVFAPKKIENPDISLPQFKPFTLPPMMLAEIVGGNRLGLEQLREFNQTRGVYLQVNGGTGDKDIDVTDYRAVFVENDDAPISEQHERLDKISLQPSIRVETKKSVHAYWLLTPGTTEEQWRELQARLIHHCSGDKTIKNPSRVMRVPGLQHVAYNPTTNELEYTEVRLKFCDPNLRYTPEELLAALPEVPEKCARIRRKKADEFDFTLPKAVSAFPYRYHPESDIQFNTPQAVKDELRRRIVEQQTSDNEDFIHAPGLCHGSTSRTGVWMSKKTSAVGCHKGCHITDILRGYGLPLTPFLVSLPNTDSANADAFAVLFGDQVRYNTHEGRWYYWDGVRWCQDTSNHKHAFELSKQTARARQRAVANYPWTLKLEEESQLASADGGGDDSADIQQLRAKKLSLARRHKIARKQALLSENLPALERLLRITERHPDLSFTAQDFDNKPHLVNTVDKNGRGITINLDTGKIRDASPDDLLTQRLGAIYDPEMKAPRFLQFLLEVFDGDTETVEFTQRWFGYCLSGYTTEQAMTVFHGKGSNGKSLLMSVMSVLLGDYAASSSFSTFDAGKQSEQTNDLARLAKRRFVEINETAEDKRLNEALVKAITSGDKLPVRYLHQEHFELIPTFKLTIAYNSDPRIAGTDDGIWRRILKVPFNKQFKKGSPEHDPNLKDKLLDELPGILNWCLEGFRKWRESGLGSSSKIDNATKEYRSAEDYFQLWFDEGWELDHQSDKKISVKDVYTNYQEWWKENGFKHSSLTKQKLTKRLKEFGIETAKGTGGSQMYMGIKKRAEVFRQVKLELDA